MKLTKNGKCKREKGNVTMDKELQEMIQESQEEWADIEKTKSIRKKKDLRIVSTFCALNNEADIIRTLELLDKHKGLPKHDKENMDTFKTNYPKELTVDDVANYLDFTDIYRRYLESGGEADE